MGDKYPQVKVAVVQSCPVFLDREKSIEKACSYIEEAGKKGVKMVAFPESFIPGHPVWYHFHPATGPTSRDMALRLFNNSIVVPDQNTDKLCQAARNAAVDVVIGICEKEKGSLGTMYNSVLFINSDGEIVGKRQKLTPTVGEKLVHTGGFGDTLHSYQFDYGKVGALICGESSNPLIVFSLMAEQTSIYVINWPNLPGRRMLNRAERALLVGRSLAFMTKGYVLNCNGTVSEDMVDLLAYKEEDRQYLMDRSLSGGSSIIAPSGDVLTGPMGPEEGLLIADLDLEQCSAEKTVHDYVGHYNRSDVFTLLINRQKPDLWVNRGKTRKLRKPR